MSRLLLAAAHVKYEDVRLKKEGVEELKKTGQLAFNQVPLLDFDGLLVVQSNAINRFLARQFGSCECVCAALTTIHLQAFTARRHGMRRKSTKSWRYRLFSSRCF